MDSSYDPRIALHSFFTPPSWRWHRARWLVQPGRRLIRHDDQSTRRAVAYLRARTRSRSQKAKAALARDYADVIEARRLHRHGGLVKLEVQARLLARQTDAEIAARTSLPPEVIGMYERLFFGVRDRLQARDWVTIRATGYWRLTAAGRTAAAVLRQAAYFGGPLVVDALLPFITGDALKEPLPNPVTPEGRLAHSVRNLLAVEMAPYDYQTTRKLMRVLAGMKAARIRSALAGKASADGLNLHGEDRKLPDDVVQVLDDLAFEALKRLPGRASAPPQHRRQPAARQIA